MAAAPQPAPDDQKSRHFIPARKRDTAGARLFALSGGIDYLVDPEAWDSLPPRTLLPGQIDRRPPAQLEAAWRNLLAAVLDGAVHDLRHRDPHIRADARDWLMRPDADFQINLADVCIVLGLQVKRVQRCLLPVRWS
jgi:hypothetical protein